jgi:hypothetical protein
MPEIVFNPASAGFGSRAKVQELSSWRGNKGQLELEHQFASCHKPQKGAGK